MGKTLRYIFKSAEMDIYQLQNTFKTMMCWMLYSVDIQKLVIYEVPSIKFSSSMKHHQDIDNIFVTNN